jgi:hypothetical protein
MGVRKTFVKGRCPEVSSQDWTFPTEIIDEVVHLYYFTIPSLLSPTSRYALRLPFVLFNSLQAMPRNRQCHFHAPQKRSNGRERVHFSFGAVHLSVS